MSLLQRKPPTFDTFEEFLDWERHQDTKHDLVDGVPVAMAGASEAHNIIQGNVFAALLTKLRGGPCRPFSSDMAMKTGANRGRYPDVSVDCGPRNAGNYALPNPTVVFEVLSHTTEEEDRTIKPGEYNDVRTISHYVLVSQSAYRLHVYDRGANGDFMLKPRLVSGLDAVLELPAIGVSLGMAEIYDELDLEAAPDPDTAQPTRSPWSR